MTMYDRLLIFDTETGGLDPDTNAILEIAAVVWERVPGGPGKILGSFRCGVADPDGICDPEALEVNKIDLPTYDRTAPIVVIERLEDFINTVYYENGAYTPECDYGAVLGGHNVATFDVGFLKRLYKLAADSRGRKNVYGETHPCEKTFVRRVIEKIPLLKWFYRPTFKVLGRGGRYEKIFSHRVIDTCSIVRFLVLAGVLPLKGASSKEVFEYFGIYPEKAHTALGDTLATVKLLDKLNKLMVPIQAGTYDRNPVVNENYTIGVDKSNATS